MQSAFHNPAVNPVRNRRDEIVRADEGGLVKFVEVKPVLHRRRESRRVSPAADRVAAFL